MALEVTQLDGELEKLSREIKELYDKYFLEDDEKIAQRLKIRIEELKKEKHLLKGDKKLEKLAKDIKQLYDELQQESDKEAKQILHEHIHELNEDRRRLMDLQAALTTNFVAGGVVVDADTKRKLDEVFEDCRELKKARSQIRLSAIGPTELAKMSGKAGLAHRMVRVPLLGKKAGTEGFEWDDRLEKAQADGYMPYLEKLISVPQDADWVGAANLHPLMLSYDSEATLGKNVRGAADVAICTRGSVKTYSPQLGVRLALGLKKRLDSAAIAQAKAALVLANYHARHLKPIVVLSDLKDDWILFWLSEKTVFQADLGSRAQAASFVQSFLAGDLAAPGPNSDEVDINARIAIPEAMLHAHFADDTLFSEQLGTLEAVGTAEDIRQWKIQRVMNLVYADPSRPSWVDP